MQNRISEVTRRRIFDMLSASNYRWQGSLSDGDFLSRMYDLSALSSTDYRLKNAAADIWQHRERWPDWPSDWVFHDSRFNLLWCDDAEFVRFLCETVNPVVRPNTDEAQELVGMYNDALRIDDWRLEVVGDISGKPTFGAAPRESEAAVFASPTGWNKVDRQLQEAKARLANAITEEQFQAVGLVCREVLISVAQEAHKRGAGEERDAADPSDTDVKALLEKFIGRELPGAGNEEARAHAKAAVRLALALQHKRTADFRTAALAAEAAASVVNILAVLTGRRG